eukprot:563962_1
MRYSEWSDLSNTNTHTSIDSVKSADSDSEPDTSSASARDECFQLIGLCVFLKYQKKKMGIQKSQEISIKITSKPKMMSSNFQPTAIARVISAPPKVIARNQKVIRVKSKPKERKVVERH